MGTPLLVETNSTVVAAFPAALDGPAVEGPSGSRGSAVPLIVFFG